MIPHTGIISLVILVFVNSVCCFENHVPVYMWNIDTDAVINPLNSINSEELVGQVPQLLEHKLIALFMQDELSIDDFRSEDLVSVKLLAEMDNDGTLFAPSVTKTARIPAVFEAAGYNVAHVKSFKDLPSSKVVDKTVLVVDLPATQLGDLRSENLQLNGNAITEVYEVLKSHQSDVVGIYTARKNSKLQMEESRRRIARSASKNNREASTSQFINVTEGANSLFLYWEKYPILRIKDEKTANWANFTLNTTDTTGTATNETKSDGQLILRYSGLNSTDSLSTLKSAVISIFFANKQGYWYVNETTITYDVTIGSANFKRDDLVLKTTDISTPFGFSWHCTPSSRFAYGYDGNGTAKSSDNRIVFETNGFQLQPFRIVNNKFSQGYDCVGFFTEGIWAAIILGLIIAMMLAWAISMLADIRTPDRYDDPKGKTIVVTATE